jgi:glycosyltransferase involved in cell wall biosynthesis
LTNQVKTEPALPLLSILIPAYNHDLTDLVKGLRLQASELEIPFEILIIDDNSSEGFRSRNVALTEMSHVRYLQLEENIGRSRIRNMLAGKARFESLLFIDADASIMAADYLSRYLGMIGTERVICGGTAYLPDPPGDTAYRLRWYYGRKREERPAKVRSKDPCRAFSSFQFLATRKIMEHVPFDNDLKAYGHEDTVFGLALEQRGIPVLHIDNTLVHDGLEPADEFLEKTRQGLQNLKFLVDQGRYVGLEQGVRILKKYNSVRKMGLHPCLKYLYNKGSVWMHKNLKRRKPRLWIFDLYKLCYFAALH